MNVLIVCTWFPPDSSIAAVRPYMFAKYLAKSDVNVTVLRSGKISKKPDHSYDLKNYGFEIIDAMGENSDAARFSNGTYDWKGPRQKVGGLSIGRLIPENSTLRRAYNISKSIITSKNIFAAQKMVLDGLKTQGRSYDVVFSTYSELENMYAGEYAAKLFEAKWIMDFRDPSFISRGKLKWYWNASVSAITKRVLREADAVTGVSEDLNEGLKKIVPEAKTYTIYNGYEKNPDDYIAHPVREKCFLMCFTGTIYEAASGGLEDLLNCIKELIDGDLIEENRIRFLYAGSQSDLADRIFGKYDLLSILENYGYVDREHAKRIQEESDLFTVLAWNTSKARGDLTGKTYEAIRASKPILALVEGDIPNSELKRWNDIYDYGFCYEKCCKQEQYDQLKQYIKGCYDEKIIAGKLSHTISQKMKDRFEYSNLTAELLDLMKSL